MTETALEESCGESPFDSERITLTLRRDPLRVGPPAWYKAVNAVAMEESWYPPGLFTSPNT